MAGDIASCLFFTGLDPFTKQQVFIGRKLRDRKLQRTRLQFFKPENYFEVGEALLQTGRMDLIGGACDAQIPAQPPKEALNARREKAKGEVRGDHVHTVPNGAGQNGPKTRRYRPQRTTAKRRDRKRGAGRKPCSISNRWSD